jgi:RimJ/RimL family protein N-acetyltransferase
MTWSDAQWKEELSRPGVHSWFARINGEIAGFVQLQAEPHGDVGIVIFGLVPEFVGQGSVAYS